MTQTCETCGRSWGDRAMFCGACGALLNRPLPGRGGTGRHPSAWWRRPIVTGGLAVLGLVGIVAAVPTLSIERTDPIEDTSIGMPDADDLQGAPAGTRPRRSVEPPDLSCTRDAIEVDCVIWSRGLLDPMGTGGNGRQPWPVVTGNRLLLVGPGEVEAVDATTGTRLWRIDMPEGSHPVGTTEDGLVLLGPQTRVVDADTGETRWSVSTSARQVYGAVGHDEIVYTGTGSDAAVEGLAARDARSGDIRWTWPTGWSNMRVERLDANRLLVAADMGGLAILDPSTGEELSRTEWQSGGWTVGLVGDTIVSVLDTSVDPSEPNRAGDPGAVLTGTDIVDGSVRWQREVRSSEGWFELVADMVIATSSRHLTTIDATTGEVVWEIETTTSEQVAPVRSTMGPWFAAMNRGQDHDLVVTLDQNDRILRARDAATGTPRWERELQGQPWHAVVRGDTTVVQTSGGVDIVDTMTGQERLRIGSPEVEVVGIDPLILFHPVSGHAARVEMPAPGDR